MSEQTTAANLDEVIETQMKQSESAWTRKTDGIDYNQSKLSVSLFKEFFFLFLNKRAIIQESIISGFLSGTIPHLLF